nr:radical SAM protein [Candidatus Sigynarchaeota archaeon]
MTKQIDVGFVIPSYDIPTVDDEPGFITPPEGDADEDNATNNQSEDLIGTEMFTEPLAPLILCSFIRQNGFEVDLHDTNIELFLSDKNESRRLKVFGNWLKKKSPKIIAIEGNCIAYYEDTMKLGKYAKDLLPNSLILTGGVQASCRPQMYLQPSKYEHPIRKKVETYQDFHFDVIINHEGEYSLLDVTKDFIHHGLEGIKEINGISYLNKDGAISSTNRRKLIEDLDTIPFPALDLYPIKLLHSFNLKTNGSFASRGCPHKCAFCHSAAYWNQTWRLRSPKNVIDELTILKSDYGTKNILFYDQLFCGAKKSWMEEFVKLYKASKLNLSFGIQMRIDQLSEEFCKMLKESDIKFIFTGIESTNPKILKNIHKAYDPSQTVQSLKNAKMNGIKMEASIIVGLPDDDKEKIDFTCNSFEKLAEDKLIDYPAVFLFNPYHGSEIGDNPEKFGISIINDNYLDWNFIPVHPVISTSHLNAEELYTIWYNWRKKLFNKYYKGWRLGEHMTASKTQKPTGPD